MFARFFLGSLIGGAAGGFIFGLLIAAVVTMMTYVGVDASPGSPAEHNSQVLVAILATLTALLCGVGCAKYGE